MELELHHRARTTKQVSSIATPSDSQTCQHLYKHSSCCLSAGPGPMACPTMLSLPRTAKLWREPGQGEHNHSIRETLH